MAEALQRTGVELVAKDSAKFQSDMAKNQKAVAGMAPVSEKASKATSGLGSSLTQLSSGNVSGALQSVASSLGPIGIAAGVVAGAVTLAWNAFDKATESVRVHINAVDDLSDRYGLGTKAAEEFLNVSQIFDLQIGSLARSFRTMSTQGIQPSVAGLLEVKNRLDAIEDPNERTKLGFKLLGLGASELADFLATDNEELKHWIGLANIASTVTNDQADAQDAFNRQLASYKVIGDFANRVLQQENLQSKQSVQLTIANVGAKFKLQNALEATGVSVGLFNTSLEEMTNLLFASQQLEAQGVEVTTESARAYLASAEGQKALSLAMQGTNAALAEMEQKAPEVAGKLASIEVPSIWDRVFPDPAELAGKIAEQAAFIKAGGPQIVGAIQEIQAGLAQGILTPEQALPMLDDLQEAALSIAVKAGDTTAWDAAKKNADDFGGSISQAKSDIADAATTVSKIPREITIHIRFLADHLPGAGYQHGGEFTVGGRSGPDANLVAFRATRGERVIVQPQSSSVVNNQRYDNRSVNAQFQGGFNPNDQFRVDRMIRGWLSSG